MKTCHIFCAGEFHGLLEQPEPGDFILAADGGLRHLQAAGLEPSGILGDFDSLGYTPQGPLVDRFPIEKDDTDSMLAVKAGLEAGCRRFLLYGALDGPRLDHTVANFQLLHYLTEHDAFGYLIGQTYLATVLAPGCLGFSREASGILSVFCSGCRRSQPPGATISPGAGCAHRRVPPGRQQPFPGLSGGNFPGKRPPAPSLGPQKRPAGEPPCPGCPNERRRGS